MLNKVIVFALFLLISSVFAYAQEATPSPTPVRKTNQRPNSQKAQSPGAPFENADIKTLASKCVKLETEAGNIELEMFPESAPETVRNFLNLTAIGFFDTTTFSRVVPDFVIQGGNFSTRLQRVPELYAQSHNIKDEPNLIKHERGILSMARSDEPNSASTHFFILVSEAPQLDGKFAAFGRVINGMDIVDAINKMPVEGEKPVKPVRLTKATVFACPAKVEQ